MIDLDAARAARREGKGEGPVLKFGGKEYQLPPELPYEALEPIRGMSDPDTAAGAMVDLMKALLGRHYDEVKSELSFDDLEAFVEGAMVEYGVSDPLASTA